MKLSKWANKQGITYRTAWTWFHNKHIPGSYQSPNGTIIVDENSTTENSITKEDRSVIYCRISSVSRKHELEYQVNRCENFCAARGTIVSRIFKEVASGMNDKRKELIKMLDYQPTTIIVENKDRLTRFGFNYLKVLLKRLGCNIIVMNEEKEDESDLIKDMISIVTSFCCRLYGLRRGRKKSTKIKEIINEKE
jgi:predicted site-specific integrase-resolvase